MATRETWNDSVRQRFEERHLKPLDSATDAAVDRHDEVRRRRSTASAAIWPTGASCREHPENRRHSVARKRPSAMLPAPPPNPGAIAARTRGPS